MDPLFGFGPNEPLGVSESSVWAGTVFGGIYNYLESSMRPDYFESTQFVFQATEKDMHQKKKVFIVQYISTKHGGRT